MTTQLSISIVRARARGDSFMSAGGMKAIRVERTDSEIVNISYENKPRLLTSFTRYCKHIVWKQTKTIDLLYSLL